MSKGAAFGFVDYDLKFKSVFLVYQVQRGLVGSCNQTNAKILSD